VLVPAEITSPQEQFEQMYEVGEDVLPPPPPPPAVSVMVEHAPRRGLRKDEPKAPNLMMRSLRNVWLPTAFLVLGFLGTTLWVGSQFARAGGAGALGFVLLFTAAPVFLVFLGFGKMRGQDLGLSFVSFVTGAFKITSLILAADAVVLWIFEWLRRIDAYTFHSVRGMMLIAALFVASVIFVIKAGSLCLFYSQDDDFVAAGFPLAMISWGAHFVLFIVLAIVFANMSTTQQAAIATSFNIPVMAPVTQPVEAAPSTAPVVKEYLPTPGDRGIQQELNNTEMVWDAVGWKNNRYFDDHLVDELVDKLLAAGALHVYVNFSGAKNARPNFGYAMLPLNDEGRARVRAVYDKYVEENNITTSQPEPDLNRFIILHFKR
jgi:hypothetical protein